MILFELLFEILIIASYESLFNRRIPFLLRLLIGSVLFIFYGFIIIGLILIGFAMILKGNLSGYFMFILGISLMIGLTFYILNDFKSRQNKLHD